ncbi:hypothetical protein F2Q69_00060706 [Brassica cretica]|uniref:Uncharacterized protein n=1 Tax=Brassica cretica TaxID=69181 RepID=A0A8S9RAP9_BRACR|nr:hypothetical protein F2Q69_00060706 [Brassica cretica]
MGCWFGAGAEPRCVYPALPSFRLERVSQVAPIARSGALTRSNNTFHSLIPNASKYLQELQRTLQHLIKTYAMQKGN